MTAQTSFPLSSPGYPAVNLYEMHCLWIVQASWGFNIKFKFHQLRLFGEDMIILADGTLETYDRFVRLENRPPDYVGFVKNRASVSMYFKQPGSYFSLTIEELNYTGNLTCMY